MRSFALALFCGVCLSAVTQAAEKEHTAASLLPATTLAYGQLSQSGELVELVLEHPLRERIEKLEAYQELYSGAKYRAFQGVLAVVEDSIGMKWNEAVAVVTEGGAYAAFDPASQGGVLLARAKSAAELEKIRDSLVKLVNQLAVGGNQPLESTRYRGLTVYRNKETRLTTFGPWLLVTNKPELGKSIVDRYFDGGPSLAENDSFQQAQAGIASDACAWAWVDIEKIRTAGFAQELLGGKAKDAGGEFVLGGVLEALNKTPYAVLTLKASPEKIVVAAGVPYDRGSASESRRHFFGPDKKSSAPPLISGEDILFALSTYRDFHAMWSDAPDLFNDATNAEFAQQEGQLSTLFGGRDFNDEVLGALSGAMQFAARRQQFQEDQITPAIKIPEFAIVFELKDPEKTGRQMKVAFQSLLGFGNIGLGQEGQPQMEMNSDATTVTGTFVPEEDQPAGRASIHYNFSPTFKLAGQRMIISSTSALATKLAVGEAEEQPAGESVVNTAAALSGSELKKVLADNRDQLIAQNMLENGHNREEAEAEVEILLTLLEMVRGASLDLVTDSKSLKLEFALEIAE